MKKVGCVYHPKLAGDQGQQIAEELIAVAAKHVDDTWVASAWDESVTHKSVTDTDLLLCVGGDGTVLRAAQLSVLSDALLLGVNMGRLGFLTELDAESAKTRLPEIIAGEGRIEERAMLHAEVVAVDGDNGDKAPARHDALNDIVIGRRTLGRTVQVAITVDGSLLAEVRADGVIIATATGSTAYSLSAGGAILPPESREILLTPLAPHLASHNSVVLPSSAVIEVKLAVGEATFSVDGERDLDLQTGETVRVALGPHRARFVRLREQKDFYSRLAHQLNWLGEPGSTSQ